MGRIWSISWFEIKRVFKKPASYALMFGMPIIFTFIFGSLLGGTSEAPKTKLALVDLDQSIVSNSIVQQISQDEMLEISQLNLIKAEKELKNKKILGIVVLPKGLKEQLANGESVELLFQHGPDLSLAATIRQSIDQVVAKSVIQIKASQVWSQYRDNQEWEIMYEKLMVSKDHKLVSLNAKSVFINDDIKQMNQTSERAVGFSIMFLMITLMTVTGTILEARKSGVWYRMLSTPTSRMEVICGYMLSFFLIGWIQFGILMILSSFLFNVHWGNLIGVVILVSAILLCVVGLGLMIAGFVRTTEQQTAIGTMFIVSTCMLGGIYWPLDVVPDFMQKIADFVPQTWAMKGFTELVARGGTVVDILGSISVLLGLAIVTLFIGVARVRYE